MKLLIPLLVMLVLMTSCQAWPNSPIKIEGEVDIIPQSGSSPTATLAATSMVAPTNTQVVAPTATERVVIATATTAPTNPPPPPPTATQVPPQPSATSAPAPIGGNCDNVVSSIEHSTLTVYAPGTNAQVTVTNTSKCQVEVGMASYKRAADKQELYAWDQRHQSLILQPGETRDYDVPLPKDCAYSIYAYVGPLSNSGDYNGRIITSFTSTDRTLCNLK